ncbi:MAG: DUF4062 domain-containing protein [Bacteroidetes bacterium]|nr:DUF4062 domain-containing protein [Bacteroidota bacterium]
MDTKKYQVFVSSTFKDLQEERQEVMQVLLEMDCIPSGMELFPAADEDQWNLIKGVIDDCDYYMVIIAGRYGSEDDKGVSFTEKEYRYAVKSGKPVIAFIHGDSGSIPNDKTESTDSGKKKLEEFCTLVKQKMCKPWTSPHELGSVVARSLNQLRKSNPGVGWVRGDQVERANAEEILRLQKTIENLKKDLQEARTKPPTGSEHYAQGNDVLKIKTYGIYKHCTLEKIGIATLSITWNEIFFAISPLMIQESNESKIEEALSDKLRQNLSYSIKVSHEEKRRTLKLATVKIDQETFRTIIIQLRALGLIEKSIRKRSVKDTDTYWKLTQYGDHVMNGLRAIP